jgi:hypothetical protein
MKQPHQGKTAVPVAKKEVTISKEATAGVTEAKASHKEETKTIPKKGDPAMETKETKTGFAGFDTQNVNENFLKMLKFSVDSTFDGLAKIQEFNDKVVKDMMKTSKQIQAETEKIVGEWTENGKKGLDEYRKVVEEGYKKFEGIVQPRK